MTKPGTIELTQGSDAYKKMRRYATESVPGKHSALYYLNQRILGREPLVPMTYRAHLALCFFAESATGIPEIDDARVKLILVPRGMGKSTIVTKGLPILRILQNRNFATGIANERQDLANTFLGDIKSEFESNQLLRLLFPEVMPDDTRSTIWAADRIITKRDKLNPTSPSILATGVGATVTGVHQDMWLVDDLISQNAAEAAYRGNFSEIEAADRWMGRLQPLLKAPKRDPIIVIGCIAEEQPVLMADGTWKPIKDVQVGDEVWACKKDGSEGFKARKVTGVWPQGEAEVVEIDVAGRQIRCTPNHPFLAARGRSDGVNRAWCEAKDLAGRKMEVFMSKVDASEEPHPQAWLLGFMLGDGWNTKTERFYLNADGEQRSNGATYAVCFSPGIDEELNARATAELDWLAPSSSPYTTPVGSVRVDSTAAGQALEALGLVPGVGAKNKSIPEWVFKSSVATKRAFLRGLGDADGHWLHEERFALELTSERLIRDVHLLAMSCGCKPTKVTSRIRTAHPPHSPEPVTSETWHVAVNFRDPEEALHKYRVKSVTPAGRAPVYDLTVEAGDCAFVTNGAAASNTRWWEGDTYERIMQRWSHNEPKREFRWTLRYPAQRYEWDGGVVDIPGGSQTLSVWRAGEIAVFKRAAIDENGRPIFPERYDLEELEMLAQEDPVFYAGQYLLEPTAGAASTFNSDWLKFYEIEGQQIRYRDQLGQIKYTPIRDLTTYISVDPAFSKKHTSARSAIPVLGTNGTELFLLEDFAERLDSEDDIAAKVVDFFLRYRPQKIFVETIVAQVAVANAIRRRFREENLGEPPLVEISSHGQQKKVMRIFGLEHYFKRGLFHIHRSQQKFLHEYNTFPRGELRDILDALAFQKDEWERLFLMGHVSGGAAFDPQKRAIAEQRAMDRVRNAFKRGRRR